MVPLQSQCGHVPSTAFRPCNRKRFTGCTTQLDFGHLRGVEGRSVRAVMAGVSPPRDAAMPVLPSRFATVILHFAPLFYHRSWRHAEVLLIGAILASGTRTVASLLRICGLMRERHFVNYHRVLNRAAWSPILASRLLLRLLSETFAPNGPVVLGLDDTIERRRGKRIAAKGIYRDPVRSSHGHFVKASGLRWRSLMLLA